MNPKNRIGPAGWPGTSTSVLVWESLLSPSSVMSFIFCFVPCPHGTVALFALLCAVDVRELTVSRWGSFSLMRVTVVCTYSAVGTWADPICGLPVAIQPPVWHSLLLLGWCGAVTCGAVLLRHTLVPKVSEFGFSLAFSLAPSPLRLAATTLLCVPFLDFIYLF